MGLQFAQEFQCQSGGIDVILTKPNLRTLRNVQGDGNCLFRAMSFVITGCERQHMEVRNAILSYMLYIENLLIIIIYNLLDILVCKIILIVQK